MSEVERCRNCGKEIFQMDISWMYEWRHAHSLSARCDAPSVAVPMTEYAERANHESATRSTRETIERTEYLTHEMERGQL